ncbi:aminopeptidase P family protein [Chitinivibrio alkaliphilus]|uniref:Peptidase M24 n=1 Tax=Chitinivibrio alkaliphilus ACht1 TaxID=1313304 RepID=U7D4W7_9BACT|nr:aminopeptidase P family protein [Chitinivibrio alkaliphilus]ERP31559.1 peptidase M24 [Chitinivibrio alkaliphilus ACht1]
MTNRIRDVRSYLNQKDLTGILLTESISIRYIADFISSNAALLIFHETVYLLTDFRYAEKAQELCTHTGWTFLPVTNSLFAPLSKVLSPSMRIGIESESLTLDSFAEMQKHLSGVEFFHCKRDIHLISAQKQRDELTYISTAAAMADRALNKLLPHLTPGIDEYSAARLLEKLCLEEGSEGPSFPTIMLFGKHSSLPHGTPSSKKVLQEGDTILIDFGCTYHGYCSDMTRTFFSTKISPHMEEIYRTVSHAQEMGKKAVRAGVSAATIDATCRSIIEDAGYGPHFQHGTGHGVGLRIHEYPALNKKSDAVLKPGMVITVEPGIYLPHTGGVRIEDLLIVTEEGYDLLSHSSRSLTCI